MPRPPVSFTVGKWKIEKCTLCEWKGRITLTWEQSARAGGNVKEITCPNCDGAGYRKKRIDIKNGD